MAIITSKKQVLEYISSDSYSKEEIDSLVSIFEGVSYNVDDFLRSNYLEVIENKNLKYDIIRFCFEEKNCIDGGYSVDIFLKTNSVILQGNRICKAFHLDGREIMLPEGIYLYSNVASRGLVKFERLNIRAEQSFEKKGDGIIRMSGVNDKYGIMTTDGKIVVPAICSAVSLSDYFGTTIVIDDVLALQGRRHPKDDDSLFVIHIPFNDSSALGLQDCWPKDGVLRKDKDKTWKDNVAAFEKLFQNIDSAYIKSEEHALHNFIIGIHHNARIGYIREMNDEDIQLCEKELQTIFSKHVK